MLLQIRRQLIGDDAVHQRADIGVAQLGLGLTLELGLRQLHGDDGGDALADVLAGDLVALLDHTVLHAVGVQHTGQRRLKAGLVHAALRGVNVVGEGYQRLVIAVVILHGDLGGGVALRAGDVDDLLVQRRFVAVDIGDEFPDAALVPHGFRLLFAGAGIGDGDAQARVQEGLLPHTGVQRLVVVLQRVEHLAVGLECDGGAGVVGVADHLHLGGDVAAGELHLVDVAVLVNLYLQPFGKGVDHGRADAVQAAGHLVAAAAELAAGMQHGEHHLQRGAARLLLDVHGNAAAIVGDGDGVAGVDGDGNVGAVAGQRFVDGVVHDLVHQMVQTAGAGGTDIHAGPLAHGLQTLKNLDLRGVVFRFHVGDVFKFRHIVFSSVRRDLRMKRRIPYHVQRGEGTPPYDWVR